MREDRALAERADVDVILGGHEHEPLIAEEGKTLITKAGSDARYLVQVDLWIGRDGRRRRAVVDLSRDQARRRCPIRTSPRSCTTYDAHAES